MNNMLCIDKENLEKFLESLWKEFKEKSEISGYTSLEYKYKADGISLVLQYLESIEEVYESADADVCSAYQYLPIIAFTADKSKFPLLKDGDKVQLIVINKN